MNPAILNLLSMGGGAGAAGLVVTFFRGVSKSPRESSGVSLPTHTLVDVGGGTYTVTENGSVSMDLTSSPNYEGYDY